MSFIRVYLFKGGHPLYETLISNPPEGVEYLPKKSDEGTQEYALYQPGHSFVRKAVDGTFSLLNMPRYYPILRRYDLVHSGRGFLILGPNKYVVDMEHIASVVGMRHDRLRSAGLRRAIERALASDKCLGLLPHCLAARKTISLVTSEQKILSKTAVVYPAVAPSRTPARGSDESPEILFMGEYFWKGGRELIAACERLAGKLDFRLTYISLRVHPPASVIEKISKKMNITYVQGPIPRKKLLDEVYPRTSLFVMPTYIDSFGFAFLEAMAYGIPCIGARHFAVPEIIAHEKTGFLVEPPVSYFDDSGRGHPELSIEECRNDRTIDEIVSALERLISSRNLRETMGAAGLREVRDGKFSIGARNSSLKNAYEGRFSE